MTTWMTTASFLLSALPTSSALAEPELHVYVGESVPIESGVLQVMRDEVEAIFRSAGFRIVWLDEAPNPAKPHQARAYILYELPPSLRGLMEISKARAPMAITLGPRPTSPGADIYISRKAVMGRAGHRRALALVHMGRAFGRTLAHELAHRFLKSGHSERGILRAAISQEDLIDADASDMFFTAEQIESLEEIAESRQ